MTFEEYMMDILEKSVEKNGEIPLTNKHLLNIMKLACKHQLRADHNDYLLSCAAEACDW